MNCIVCFIFCSNPGRKIVFFYVFLFFFFYASFRSHNRMEPSPSASAMRDGFCRGDSTWYTNPPRQVRLHLRDWELTSQRTICRSREMVMRCEARNSCGVVLILKTMRLWPMLFFLFCCLFLFFFLFSTPKPTHNQQQHNLGRYFNMLLISFLHATPLLFHTHNTHAHTLTAHKKNKKGSIQRPLDLARSACRSSKQEQSESTCMASWSRRRACIRYR